MPGMFAYQLNWKPNVLPNSCFMATYVENEITSKQNYDVSKYNIYFFHS